MKYHPFYIFYYGLLYILHTDMSHSSYYHTNDMIKNKGDEIFKSFLMIHNKKLNICLNINNGITNVTKITGGNTVL